MTTPKFDYLSFINPVYYILIFLENTVNDASVLKNSQGRGQGRNLIHFIFKSQSCKVCHGHIKEEVFAYD